MNILQMLFSRLSEITAEKTLVYINGSLLSFLFGSEIEGTLMERFYAQ